MIDQVWGMYRSFNNTSTGQIDFVYGDRVTISFSEGNTSSSNLFVYKNRIELNGSDTENVPIPLLGVATPLSVANADLGITADDLPYQAANKKYVDDEIAKLTAKIEALSK